MTCFETLEISVGGETERLAGFAADFGEPAGAEVLVFYGAPETAHLHVYGREIADGALSCSLGARRAAVTMDLGLAMRIVTEGLRAGLSAPRAEGEALRGTLAAAT